jgi:fatty acid desaturase
MLIAFVGLGVLMYLAGGWETVTSAPVMIVMALTLLVLFFGLPALSKRQLAKAERMEMVRRQAAQLMML